MLHNYVKCQRCGSTNPVGAQVLDYDSENIAMISIANPLNHGNVRDYSHCGRSQENADLEELLHELASG